MTPSNNTSTVIDFPKDESVQAQAARWLAALDVDQPSEETLIAFKLWINSDEAHRREFESIAAFWGDLNVLTQLTPPRNNFAASRRDTITWMPVFASAVVIFLAVFSFIFLRQMHEPQVLAYVTAVGEQKTIELSDQSTVFLNTDSRIVVDFTDKVRSIYLERGEAMFEVAHDKMKPFEVHAGDRIVRAVGTAFSVYLRPDNVEVLVTEGVVEIDEPESLSEPVGPAAITQTTTNTVEKVRVKAGSQALFNNNLKGQVLVAELKRVDDKVAWRNGVLTFDREPLATVVNEVSRYTTTKLIVPDKDVREMIVGGVFKVGDTESLFEALQLGFGIHAHEVADNVISLSRTEVEPY